MVALQSKIDLLIYPMKMAAGSDGSAKPYLGGGVGIVRSNMDVDIEKDEPTQVFIKAWRRRVLRNCCPKR